MTNAEAADKSVGGPGLEIPSKIPVEAAAVAGVAGDSYLFDLGEEGVGEEKSRIIDTGVEKSL